MQRTRRGSYNRGRGIDGRSLLGGNQPGGNLLTEEQRRMVEQQQMLLTMQAMNQQEQASMFSPSLSTLSLANLMPTRGAAPTMVPPPLMALQHLSAPAPVPSPNSLYNINPSQLLSNMSSRERTRDEESASWKGREYDNNIKAGRGLGRQQRQQENSMPACRGSDQEENNWNKPQVWTDSWDYRPKLSDEDRWTRSDNRKPPTWQDKTRNISKEQPSWPSKSREFEEQRWTTDKLNQQEKTRGSRPEQSLWPSKSREAEEKRWTTDKPKSQDKAGVSRQDQTAWPSKSRESEEQMWNADKQRVEGRWTEWPKSETQSWPTRSVGDNWTSTQEEEKWSKMPRDPEEIWNIRNTEDPKAQTGWIGRQSDNNARMKRPREQMERPWMGKLDQDSWNKNVTEPEKGLWTNKPNEASWDKLSVEPPVQDWGKKPKLSKDREEKNWSERPKVGEDQRWMKRSDDLSSAQHQDTWTKNLKQDTDRWVDGPRKGDDSWKKQSIEQEVRVWNQNPIPSEQVNWAIKGIGDRSIGEHDQQIWMGRDSSSRGGETVSTRAKSSDVWTDGHTEQLPDKLQVDSNNFLYPDLGMVNKEEVWSRLNKKNGDSLRLSESSVGRALVGGNEDWGERGDGLAGWLDGERGQVCEGDVQEVPWVEHRMGWLNSQLELVDRRMGQLDDRQLWDLPPRDLTEVWENQGTILETRALGPSATTQQQNEGRESDLRLLLRSKRTRTEPDYGGWKENMVVVFPWTRKTKLGPRDMAELRQELISLIHGLLEKKDCSEQPRFFGTGLVSPGWFLVDCADKTSADWLITSWKPTIRNKSRSRLIVGLARDAIRVTFVGIYLKGVSEDIRLIESRLHSQNPIFKVNTWRRGPYKKTPSGMSITYLVDDAIIKLFLQYTWHIYYELAKVRIRSLEHKPIPPLHVLRF